MSIRDVIEDVQIAWENTWGNRPAACARRRAEWDAELAELGLTRSDVDRLARFNSQRDDGLIHAPEYVDRMAELQTKYNQWLGHAS